MRTRKEIKEYLEQLEDSPQWIMDDEEYRVIEVQKEILEWVLK